MEFRQIQYFVALYEERSVTRAARRLNIVQPALSMQIARLEAELGRALFERNPRGVEPTPLGRQMYRLYLPLLREFASARERLMDGGGEMQGHVSVGMIASIALGVLPEVLAEFGARHPSVSVSIADGYSEPLADRVTAGQLDAALINRPRRPLALSMEPLVGQDVMLLSSPRHHPGLTAPVALASLADLRLALPTRHHGLRGILDSFARAEDVDLAPQVEVDSIGALVRLVEASPVVTLLPPMLVREPLAQGRLQAAPVHSPRLRREIVCVTHPRRPPPPATTAFLALLRERLQALEASGLPEGGTAVAAPPPSGSAPAPQAPPAAGVRRRRAAALTPPRSSTP